MSSQGDFTVPPSFGQVGNYSGLPSYGIGSTLNIQWTFPENELYSVLWLLQDGDSLSCDPLNLALSSCQQLIGGNTGESFNWPLTAPANYSVSSPIYYLSMRNSTSPFAPYFDSHYFNILPQSLLPTSSIASTSTTSTTRSTTIATTTTSSNATTAATAITTAASTSSSETGSPDTNSTTKIAVGVAVGVGVPLILVLAAIAFFLRKNHKRRSTSSPGEIQARQEVPKDMEIRSPPHYYENPPFQPPQEMSQDNYHRSYTAELHNDRSR